MEYAITLTWRGYLARSEKDTYVLNLNDEDQWTANRTICPHLLKTLSDSIEDAVYQHVQNQTN